MIQSRGLCRAPLRPGCSDPGRLFVVFSLLPWTLQFVAPGSPPDDPVRGLGPCSTLPRMLQSRPPYVVFSPLPRTLQSVAPVSPPDDPVRGLGPSSTLPRMLQSRASCIFLSLLSSAHQPHSARSCDLALRAVGAARGRPGGRLMPGCGASGVGRSPTPDHSSFGACGQGPLPAGRGCGVRAWGPGCPWHLVPCRGSSCVVRASRVRGTRWKLWLGTCPCAMVVAGSVPLWRASWPRVGAPLLVRSGRSRCSGRFSCCRGAFPNPGWLRGARGGRPRTGLIGPAAGPCRGKGARRAPRRTRSGPRDGVVPGGSLQFRSWAACLAVVWRVWPLSLTRPVSRTVRLSTGNSAGAPGLFRADANTAPFGSEDVTPGSRACVCACSSWPGRAGRPPGRVLVRLTFTLAVLGALFACSAPSGQGCPVCGCCWVFFFSPSPSPSLLRPRCVLLCVFSGPGCLGPWRLVAPPLFFSPSPPPLCAPLSPAFRVLQPRVPCASAPCCPPPSPPRFFCILPPSCPPPVVSGVSRFPAALGLCAPLPPLFFVFFPLLFFFCRLCGAGRVCASWAVGCPSVCLVGAVPVVTLSSLAGVVCRWPLGLAVPCCLPVGLGVVLWWCCPCLAAWLAALWFGAVCLGVPLPCVVLCCGVLSCGVVLSCSAVCLRRCLCLLFVSCCCASAVCVLGCRAVCHLSSPPCAVLCCAVLVPFCCAVRVVCAVFGGLCCWFPVSLPFVGGLLVALVAWLCHLVVCVGFGARVWSGRRSASSLWCPAPLCCVLWRCAAVWFCAVVPCLLFFCFSPCLWRWFPVVPRWFWAPGRFRVVSVSVLCLCGAVLVCLHRCSLFGVLLPSRGWLVFCVVACCVCVFAVGPGCPLLSPGGSWWLLVLRLGGVLWCVPGCCAAPCCCALCRLALRCCALCCFLLLRLVLPRAVLCPGALSVVLGSCAFWRRVLSCPPALCVFCCGVSLRDVVRRCALCRVRPVVSCCAFPVVPT